MHPILPPICLLLAMAMAIVGFGLWILDPPEPNIDLHRARVTGDDAYQEVLESQLLDRQRNRKWLVRCLFAKGFTDKLQKAWLAMPKAPSGPTED